MRYAVLSLALVFGTAAVASELDNERTVAAAPAAPSADQIAKAAALPQTTIVRVSKTDPNKMEVVFLKDKLAAGKKLKGAKFEELALNNEKTLASKTGIAYASAADELDGSSSTSSWSFGYARGPWGGSAGYVRGPWGGAGFVRGPNGGVIAGGYRNYPYYGGGGYYGGNYGYGYGYGAGYGAGYGYNNGCYNNYGCGNGCYNNCYQPTYVYSGYNYNCTPYYGYSDNNWNYTYYGLY
ncbi:MAG: hypothetical protein KF799_01260 [Bdellovibrionales bacterium]|nr:hypothetical protein [Bdellovibrionales bacterium]